MELTTKNYKTVIIKNYIKTNPIFFLFNGTNQKAYDWIVIEQVLKNMNFKYYKIFNKTTIKTLDKSVYQNVKTTINGVTFFIKPTLDLKSLKKRVLLNNFEPLLFTLITIKINNKIYSTKQLKNTLSLDYKTVKLVLYQFQITYLKFYHNFRNNVI